MCWQCAVNKPDVYLKIFDSFKPHSWFLDIRGRLVFQFELEGITYHTNPEADISFFPEALPGEYDGDGEPWFIEGECKSH